MNATSRGPHDRQPVAFLAGDHLSAPRRRVADLLFAPSARIRDPLERQNARLVAAITFAFMIHAICLVFVVRSIVPPECVAAATPSIIVIALGYFAAYLTLRSRAARLGTYLTLAVQVIASPAVAIAFGPRLANAEDSSAWLTFAVLTATVLPRPNGVLIVGGGSILLNAIALAAVHADQPHIGKPIAYLIGLTLVVYVLARHRNEVEALRQAELRDRNESLESLRATLEERVADRTSALEMSRGDLETAYYALKENQATLLQSEKMAAIGRLTAGFAHELASPIGAVAAAATDLAALRSELERSVGDASVTKEDLLEIASEMKDAIQLIDRGATRSANFVRGIRAHTRDAGPRDRVRFDVVGVIRDSLQLVSHLARAGHVSTSFEEPSHALEIVGPPNRLSQAIVNVVGNAVDAVGENGGGNVHIALVEHDDRVVLTVTDDGPGIRPSVMPRIFEPLFTTKPHGKGTGLGLAIVDEIVRKEFLGTVSVESAGTGTTFSLALPK